MLVDLKLIGKKQRLLIFFLLLGLITLVGYFFTRDRKTQVNWHVAPNEASITSEGYPCQKGVVFSWRGDVYEGANCIYSSYDTPQGKQTGPMYAFFHLKKNNQTVLSLDKDENEMRSFSFFDCGDELCIFGRKFGKPSGIFGILGLNPTPDEDLSLILWPSGKQLLFSNPCYGKQITNHDIKQISTGKFLVILNCASYEGYPQPHYYKGEIEIKN
ncbi:hypothetical protein FJZ40_03955 [Candidatus Shapirobacteria bacterium]|nr:hypothetical protein [Candidatus Shapirobacteria bacterium]